MIEASSVAAKTVSKNPPIDAVPLQRSFGERVVTAFVILLGIGIGWIVAVIIAFATGWIQIDFC